MNKVLISLALLALMILPLAAPFTASTANAEVTGTVLIGALLPLTGDLASYGANSNAAIQLAVQDVNQWLQQHGYNFQIQVQVEDTQTDPTVATEKFQVLQQAGVQVIIGPQTSAEVSQVKQLADQYQILVISQSSTAPALGIPDDFVYRFCPTDVIQGPVIAKVMADEGIKAVIPIVRNDDWGSGLYTEAINAFQQLVPDATVAQALMYDPQSANFANIVDQANSELQGLLDQGFTKDQIGVLAISFNEIVQIFQQADQYDNLKQVKWFGSDGTALLQEVLDDPVASAFSEQTFFVNPIFSAPNTTKMQDVSNRIKQQTGTTPDTYALAAYDAVWAVALSIIEAGEYTGPAIKQVLPQVVANQSWYDNTGMGATGFIELNENGDRAAADYALWIVQNGEWVQAGMYFHTNQSIVWFIQPPAPQQPGGTGGPSGGGGQQNQTNQTTGGGGAQQNQTTGGGAGGGAAGGEEQGGGNTALIAAVVIIIIIVAAAYVFLKK